MVNVMVRRFEYNLVKEEFNRKTETQRGGEGEVRREQLRIPRTI